MKIFLATFLCFYSYLYPLSILSHSLSFEHRRQVNPPRSLLFGTARCPAAAAKGTLQGCVPWVTFPKRSVCLEMSHIDFDLKKIYK